MLINSVIIRLVVLIIVLFSSGYCVGAVQTSSDIEYVSIYNEKRVLDHVKNVWGVVADADQILRAMEEPDPFSSGITLGTKISGLLTAIDILEKTQKGDYVGALNSGAEWTIPTSVAFSGYPWLASSGQFGYAVYRSGSWLHGNFDRIGIDGQFEYYFYYRDEFNCSHHEVVSGNCFTLFLKDGWLSKPTGSQSGIPSTEGRITLTPEQFFEYAGNLYDARELASNRPNEEAKLKREFITALQIEEGLDPSLPTECDAACAEKEGLGGDEVAVILGETANAARYHATRALEPKIKSGLSGEDFVKILGDTQGSWRTGMIKSIWEHAKPGMAAYEVAATLGVLTDAYRRHAVNSLEPRIKYGLTGSEFALILGDTQGQWRASMIKSIWGHAKPGLDADEVAAILGDTVDSDRSSAIRSLEPRIKYDLTGAEFAIILGNAEGTSRANMINLIWEHAKPGPRPGLGVPDIISRQDNVSSNNVEVCSDAFEVNMRADDKKSYVDLLPISQPETSKYRFSGAKMQIDTLNGKS